MRANIFGRRIGSVRHIYIGASFKNKRQVPNRVLNIGIKNKLPSLKAEEVGGLDKKLKNLRKFTGEVRKKIQTLNDYESLDASVDRVYEKLVARNESEYGREHLIPDSVLAKLPSQAVQMIRLRYNTNWEAMIDMAVAGNPNLFVEVSIDDVEKFIKAVPSISRGKKVGQLEELLENATIKKTQYIYDLFLDGLAYRGDLDLMEGYYHQMIVENIQPGEYTLASMFRAISKASKNMPSNDRANSDIQRFKNDMLNKVDEYLEIMRNLKIIPNLVIYTNIFQVCYKLRDYDQAVEIFDTCKYNNLKPDLKMYNLMFLLESKKANVERVLDLFQEMSEAGVEADSASYLIIAKACTERDKYLTTAWEMVAKYFDLENHKATWNTKIVEVMLLISSKSGDLEFTRMVFLQWFNNCRAENLVPGPEMFNLLFESYKNFEVQLKSLPEMSLIPKLADFRKALIESVNFEQLYVNNENMMKPIDEITLPPLLPLKKLFSSYHVIQEADAIWAFMLLNYPGYFNIYNVSSYLKVYAKHSENAQEFKSKFEQLTFFDTESKLVTIEEDPISEPQDILDSPLAIALSAETQRQLKIPRTNELYQLGLFAASRLKDIEVMRFMWKERGQYRLTSRFQNLSMEKQDTLDFVFARRMIKGLLELGCVRESLAIVLSTKKQFVWTRYYSQNIYNAADKIGDLESKRILIELWRKNGKLTSSDFRKYVKQKEK